MTSNLLFIKATVKIFFQYQVIAYFPLLNDCKIKTNIAEKYPRQYPDSLSDAASAEAENCSPFLKLSDDFKYYASRNKKESQFEQLGCVQ